MSEENWYPSEEEYTPNLSKDDWLGLLQDEKIFDYNSMCLMRRLKDIGGQATFTQLAEKYGKSADHYAGITMPLAKRVLGNSNCNEPPKGENGYVKTWSILFLFKDVKNDKAIDGSYICKLRPELSAALDEIDLTKYELYEKKEVKSIIANITWNSNGWKGISEDKSNHRYVKEGGIAHESWNFDFENPRNTEREIFGFAQFTNPPKNCDNEKYFIVFRSDNKIVGFYGDATIKSQEVKIDDNISYNLIGNQYLSVFIDKNIDDTNKKFLFGKDRVGQGGFNYVNNEDALSIISEAIKLNPSNHKLNDLKNWFLSKLTQGDTTMPNINDKIESYKNLLETNKNLILHGAPGTGKTHTAKDIAALMICGKSYAEVEKDEDLNKQFHEQTEFVQFHPSYDYSDFVEGLRPKNDDNGNVGFERRDGVFKEFCAKALKAKDVEQIQFIEDASQTVNQKDTVTSYKNLEKPEFYIIYKSIVDDIKNRKITYYNTPTTQQSLSVKNDRILFRANTNTARTESEDNFQLLYNHFIGKNQFDLSNITQPEWFNLITQVTNGRTKTIDYIEYSWLLQEMLNRAAKYTVPDEYDIKQNSHIQHSVLTYAHIIPTKKIIKQPYVFIIDEINRGEMSKILGELFFSIDPDYRGTKGKVRTQYANMLEEPNDFDEALGTATSYGHFFVPENVYIIGTMNDIDRSVDSMDFAMRRRFTFVELRASDCIGMLEDLQLSEGISKEDLSAKMKALNSEIEKTQGLSSAYHIGGSYFAKLTKYADKPKAEAYECLWNNHLKPVITDYLRGLPNLEDKLSSFKTKYDEAGFELAKNSDD